MNIQFPSKIIRWGNSAGFRLRKEFMQSAGLSIGDQVMVSVRDSDNAIVIKKIEGDKWDGKAKSGLGTSYLGLWFG